MYIYSIRFKDRKITGGVRTHADICPLDLKSNALTTRPPCCLLPYAIYKIYMQCMLALVNDGKYQRIFGSH
ncbi:hypothetical protein T06_7028 [Trichinella sp. T6]|nr:hypothetical protein T06_7028 [Trichinella sp. T6]